MCTRASTVEKAAGRALQTGVNGCLRILAGPNAAIAALGGLRPSATDARCAIIERGLFTGEGLRERIPNDLRRKERAIYGFKAIVSQDRKIADKAFRLLRELIRNEVQQAAVCAIRDPETAKKAMKAGVGKVINVELGGKLSKLGGAPVKGKAYVKSISDGRYTVVSPMGAGTKFDVGPAIGLLIEGVDVAVISGPMQAFDASLMKMLGFDPKDYRIVVVKSQAHSRAWWTDVASAIIDCDPPGIASDDLSPFAFQKKTRKVFPLDAVYPEPGEQKI